MQYSKPIIPPLIEIHFEMPYFISLQKVRLGKTKICFEVQLSYYTLTFKYALCKPNFQRVSEGTFYQHKIEEG